MGLRREPYTPRTAEVTARRVGPGSSSLAPGRFLATGSLGFARAGPAHLTLDGARFNGLARLGARVKMERVPNQLTSY